MTTFSGRTDHLRILGGKRGNPTGQLGYIIAIQAVFLQILQRKGGIAITKERLFIKRWIMAILLVITAGWAVEYRQRTGPVTYTVTDGSAVWVHTTTAGTPEEVLAELGLGAEENWQAEGLRICLPSRHRVQLAEAISRQEQYTQVLPGNTIYYGNPALPEGTEQVLQPGQIGEVLCAAAVTYTNGVETNRALQSRQLLRHPEDRIVAVGTGQWLEEPGKSTMPIIGDGLIILPTGEVLTYSAEIRSLATAYCDKGKTATGTQARVGAIAVDPDYIPYGTRMFIMTLDGEYIYGIATAEDTGSKKYIHDTRIDLHFDTYAECRTFGARWCRVFFLS